MTTKTPAAYGHRGRFSRSTSTTSTSPPCTPSTSLNTTALALKVAKHGFAASCEIAVGLASPDFDPEEAVRQSEAMYDAADELGKYVAEKRAQHEEM